MARVERRAAELGTTARKVGLAAGLSEDALRKSPESRRITTIEKVGEKLGWSLAEVLGLESSPSIDSEALRLSMVVAERATRRARKAERQDLMIRISVAVYKPIAALVKAGARPSDAEVISMMDYLVLSLMKEYGLA